MDLNQYVLDRPELQTRLDSFLQISDADMSVKLQLFEDEPYFEASPMTLMEDYKEISGGMGPISAILDFIRPKQFKKDPFEAYQGYLLANDHSYGKTEVCRYNYLYYRSLSPTSRGTLLIIVPPIQGLTYIEKNVAMHAVRDGTHCLIALPCENPTDKNRPIKDLQSMQLRAIKGIRHMIDFSRTFKDLNPERLVAFGVSLGGNTVALALGVEPRIKAAVTFVAGGNFPDMLADSTQPLAKGYRDARMQIEGLASVEFYREELKKNLTVDVLYFAKRRSPRDLFMVMGEKDVDVPFANQVQLWKAMGCPRYTLLNRGHVRSIIRYPFFYKQAYDFLFERLKTHP